MWRQAGWLSSLPRATGKEDQTQVRAAQRQPLNVHDAQLRHPCGWEPPSPPLHIIDVHRGSAKKENREEPKRYLITHGGLVSN